MKPFSNGSGGGKTGEKKIEKCDWEKARFDFLLGLKQKGGTDGGNQKKSLTPCFTVYLVRLTKEMLEKKKKDRHIYPCSMG